MTSAGPWDLDAMWVPDTEDSDKPHIVRKHYFVVAVSVYEDGFREIGIESEVMFDHENPVYYPDKEEWGCLDSDTLRDSDSDMEFDLRNRLGINP